MRDGPAPPAGVLPCQDIARLIEGGAIRGVAEASAIQPASLDLALGTRAHRVRASFLAGAGRSVEARLPEFEMHAFDLAGGAVLERGAVYLVRLAESLALPGDLRASCNAKSSTGRVDVMTRVIADDGTEFDRVPAGYEGPLWAEICPRSFAVLVRPGLSLAQIRFFRGGARLSDDDLRAMHAATPLATDDPIIDGGLSFSVDLGGALAGWRAKPHPGMIDLTAVGAHDPHDYWDPVRTEGGPLILDPGAFYILQSREAVRVPEGTAAEMAPYMAVAGEFRVHYAGFFDPGFGEGAPARGVLEVRCHEAPFALEHGQVVGRLVYERMAAVPDLPYGAARGSNYHGQGLRLSKHFRAP